MFTNDYREVEDSRTEMYSEIQDQQKKNETLDDKEYETCFYKMSQR